LYSKITGWHGLTVPPLGLSYETSQAANSRNRKREKTMKQLTKTQMAVLAGKSVYHSLRVKSVADGMAKTERALKASTNVKLGKRVTKGKLAGFPILTLTLEERATCPASCIHYADCYGNNMMNATR